MLKNFATTILAPFSSTEKEVNDAVNKAKASLVEDAQKYAACFDTIQYRFRMMPDPERIPDTHVYALSLGVIYAYSSFRNCKNHSDLFYSDASDHVSLWEKTRPLIIETHEPLSLKDSYRPSDIGKLRTYRFTPAYINIGTNKGVEQVPNFWRLESISC